MKRNHNYSVAVDLAYKFHAVGQGLFATGRLDIDIYNKAVERSYKQRPFRWVYDCGTSSGKKILRDRIRQYRQVAKPNKLPLVFVSHFDEDHMNGLAELLSEVQIHQLILPWIPFPQRIEIAFSEDVAPASDAFLFFVNPVGYLGSRFPNRIDEIVFAPPSGEEGVPLVEIDTTPDSDTLSNQQDLPYPRLEVEYGDIMDGGKFDQEQAEQVGSRLQWLRRNGRLHLLGIYEFIPYNDQRFQPVRSKDFIRAVEECKSEIARVENSGEREFQFRRLKKIYHDQFTGKARNGISLFVYGGRVSLREEELFCWNHRFGNREETVDDTKQDDRGCLPGWLNSFRSSILYTGDGYLNSPALVHALEQHFHRERMNKLGILQVMHHGSRHNYFSGISGLLRNGVSVFSSDPTGQFRHPDAEVLQEFMWKGPVQVSKLSDYEFLAWFSHSTHPRAFDFAFCRGMISVPTRIR